MNNEYTRTVKDIASEYSGIVSSSGVFTGDEAATITRGITDEVMPLLNFEKPKVLVYGIYNSGKSTLVNAICGREVAEVANRPMTWKVDEYDAGKFVLVDSPGIDAPHEHEVIADAQINACHVILFVMSSRGGFESITNYQKMWDIIKRNLPFIIVLNERAVTDDDMEQHLIDMNNMKRKVIENLKHVSGRKDIENCYDVIVLNAQRAWNGISKGKKNMLANSHLSDLTNRIDQLLESKEVMKTLLAPLSALERKIGEGEKILMAKTAGEDYALKRKTLQEMITNFTQSFNDTVRYAAEKHFDEIYQGFIGNTPIDMRRLYDGICQEAEEMYKRQSLPLIGYIRTNFSALNIKVDDSGRVTLNAPSDDGSLVRKHDLSDDDSPSKHYEDDGSIFDDLSAAKITSAATAGAAAGAALGSFVPVLGTALGGAIGGAAGGVIEFFREIFDSASRREAMEYERRKREVDAFNAREARRAEEENRRRQDARLAATNQVNAIVQDLRQSYSDVIERNYNGVMQLVDKAIARISTGNQRIQSTLAQLKGLRGRIQGMRREITC